jgi:hypothetical protein
MTKQRVIAILLLIAALMASACAGTPPTESSPATQPPTQLPPTQEDGSETILDPVPVRTAIAVQPTPTLRIASSPIAAATSTAVAATAAATTSSPPESYEVAFVAPNDTLNVRSGPGVSNPVIAELSPRAAGLRLIGEGENVNGWLWVPIETSDAVSGWVNSRYLTGELATAAFCGDPAVDNLLRELETALASQNGSELASLVHPQRGLRMRLAWWNPEIYFTREQVGTLFTSDETITWGTENGSGAPIEGPFRNIVYPLLQNDLLGAGQVTCDEIDHGPTAGLTILPEAYDSVNHVSYYRQGSDALQFDWGTWVVGIERWQGQPYLAFLVHYAYEI